MYQSREIVSQGTINLGTRGPKTFVRGHIVSGRPVTQPKFQTVRDILSWAFNTLQEFDRLITL